MPPRQQTMLPSLSAATQMSAETINSAATSLPATTQMPAETITSVEDQYSTQKYVTPPNCSIASANNDNSQNKKIYPLDTFQAYQRNGKLL